MRHRRKFVSIEWHHPFYASFSPVIVRYSTGSNFFDFRSRKHVSTKCALDFGAYKEVNIEKEKRRNKKKINGKKRK